MPISDFIIRTLADDDVNFGKRAAELLHAEAVMFGPDIWPSVESALEELASLFVQGAILRIAVSDQEQLIGLVAARSHYSGHTWEINPLLVHPEYRLSGLGKALLADVERRIQGRGGLSAFIKTYDEDNRTSLSDRNLYPDVLTHLQNIKNTAGHPYVFYQKMGYTVVGVIPDAHGPGKPDILMAKRFRSV